MVMRIGYQIALSPPDGAEARPDWSALSDVWREHVLPHAEELSALGASPRSA
ncbi:hypothetical protein EMIHUDRAFT_254649 [Emiliania huxleyi CCMP1516]|uniref:Uncharacterized protein n=2 Tax=Emiliania huxleyi TaxID=2903 RepID=A0A0D3JP65_EMIH1|nr:hypothetical protein EMIHUDRAFT_254649 [Emiliania huxleyi CCMP1516]EOD25300.1 hypothetical protein EMIHUDRAFT_254649 [Emiliania huxleyi CCMP1516]|eukprot:XP_005777729.1 hypothetical protein EMIHUDRAFT_254649 [Emiliania huxleyi CCMP1516]